MALPRNMNRFRVVSDLVCPWCYIGKRRLEAAVRELPPGTEVAVSWHPFQLNPGMPRQGMDRHEYRLRKFGDPERSQAMDAQLREVGKSVGIDFRFDLQSTIPNTFDSHRVIWLAGQFGLQDAVVEALFQAYFCQGANLAAREHLEQAISAYDPERHKGLASTYGGLDPGVCCLEYVAWTLWLLGYPDQALKRADEAQPLAKRVANLYTQARSLYWDSLVRQFTGQWDVLREKIEVAISMAKEHGFALVLGVGPIMRGWALATEAQAEEGHQADQSGSRTLPGHRRGVSTATSPDTAYRGLQKK